MVQPSGGRCLKDWGGGRIWGRGRWGNGSRHVLLWGLLVCDVEEADAGESADEEDDVEPAMVEVELKVTKHLCYDHPETGEQIPSNREQVSVNIYPATVDRYPSTYTQQQRTGILQHIPSNSGQVSFNIYLATVDRYPSTYT